MRPVERLLTPRFAVVVACGLCYFVALGMLLPVVPRYVHHRLGGGDVAVGVAVGALFLGAVLLRPLAGRVGDRLGRRLLIVGGALVVSVSVACAGLVASLPYLVAVRALTGLGEAAFFVGAATMVTDLAPVTRRGEALNYWSVAVYGGLAFGPALGEEVLGRAGYSDVWLTAGALAMVAALLGLATRETMRRATVAHGPIVHRAAVPPGIVLSGGLVGVAGFTAFVPLYVGSVGLHEARGIFLLYGVVVLLVRVVGARLPDRLGPRVSGTIALAGIACGLAVIAGWHSVAGLVLGTIVFALGMSQLYPALLLLALTGVPDGERASVVGTFSSFFDLAQGFGAFALGGVASVAGYRGAFAAAGLLALGALVLLRRGFDPRAAAPGAADVAEPVPA